MFNKSFKIAALAGLASVSLLASPAAAAPIINCTTTNCTFGNNNPTVGTGPFTDLYTFTLPFARTFTATIFSQAVNFPVDNVNFPVGGVKLNSLQWARTSVGNPEIRSITAVLGAGTHTISVKGNSGAEGVYNGSASLAGVPEPMTWAMLIMGFGLVGFSLRRRKVQAVRVAYA